jgi:hypothetical protein
MLISRGGLHYKNVDFRFTENETSEIGRYGREILSDIAAPLPLSLSLSLSLSLRFSYRIGDLPKIFTQTARHASIPTGMPITTFYKFSLATVPAA